MDLPCNSNFGGWNPIRASLGAYFFGIFQILALKLQSYALGLTQVLPLIPFPLMILTLVLFKDLIGPIMLLIYQNF